MSASHEATLALLKRARRWCVREFAKRRKPYEHASHVASEVLLEAEKLFELGTFGVEGFTFPESNGRAGVSYLNAGDSYVLTLCVRTDLSTARFGVRSLASYVGG